MAPCTHACMKRLFCLKAKNGLITSIYANEARGGLILTVAGRVRSKKKNRKKKRKKIRPTQNTPRNPQQPGDRVQFETACEETHPTR